MKFLLTLLVGLMGALLVYVTMQDARTVKIDELGPIDFKHPAPARGTLKVLIWKDYFPEEVFERMKVELGITVEVSTFTSTDEFFEQLRSGVKFDVAMPADFVAHRLDREDATIDIQYANIPNHKNIYGAIRQSEEMGSLFRCSVPYIFGTVALGYNASHVERLPLKWSALFDPRTPELMRGRGGLIDDARFGLGIALLATGKSPNSRNPEEIRAAGRYVIDSMQHLNRLGNYDIRDLLQDERLYLAMAWGGDIAYAMERNKDLRFLSPDEGAMVFFDCFVIMRDSTQHGLAEEFINYLLRPDISAQVTNFSYYATLNEKATPYIHRNLLNGPAYYLPAGPRLNYRADLGEVEKVYSQVWDEVRAYHAAHVKPVIEAEVFLSGQFIDSNDAKPVGAAP